MLFGGLTAVQPDGGVSLTTMSGMSEIREAVIVDTIRTAFGKRKGALAHWHPTDLLGHTLRHLLERNDVDPDGHRRRRRRVHHPVG